MGNGGSGPKYMEPIIVQANPATTKNKNKLNILSMDDNLIYLRMV